MTFVALEAPVWNIGTLTINGTDADGAEWRARPTTGWYDDPDPTVNIQLLPHGQGAYWANEYNQPRVIVLPGHYDGPSFASANAARDKLAGLFGTPGTRQILTCSDNGVVRSCLVGKYKRSVITPVVNSNFDFTLSLVAADPRKYAPAQTSTTAPASSSSGLDWSTGGGLDWSTGGGLNWGSQTSTGQVAVSNTGTADTWPTFTVAANGGTIVNPVITDASGFQLGFALSMSGSDQLVITTDPLNRSVLLNGTDRIATQTSLQFWSIAPGATDVVSFGFASFTGSPTLSMVANPAYW